tara:strand:- start:130 stop:615 length:486 start_codon:yes stop_codon:yes gene_type:complete
MKVKYINPLSVKGVFEDLSEHIMEVLDSTDRQLLYDVSKFDRQHLIDNWNEVQKKSDSFSRDLVYQGDLHSLAVEIVQVILFGRRVRQHPNVGESNDYGFPQGMVPKAFSFAQDYDKSSGKELKKKNNDFRRNAWKDYFKAERVFKKLSLNKKQRLRRQYG